MEFELTKEQRKVVNATSNEEYHKLKGLNCVHIRKGIIEAANGFVAIQKEIDYNGEEKILIEKKEFANHKDKTANLGVIYSFENTNEIKATGKFTNLFCSITPNEPYYDIDALFPKYVEPEFQIALGKSVLQTLLNCLGKDENIIRFHFYGKVEPIKFDTKDGITKGVLMPMFVSWDD